MTGWYNLRSLILLFEGLLIFAATAYLFFYYEYDIFLPGTKFLLLAIILALFWHIQTLVTKRFFSRRAILIVFLVAYISGAWFGENYINCHREYWPRWAKQSLHAIQLTLERYAADNEGHYPPFLIGGDSSSSSPQDPLIRYGYIESYPRCAGVYDGYPYPEPVYAFFKRCFPWAIRDVYYYALPADVKRLQEHTDDPYGTNGADRRFGSDYKLMGNVAADHRSSQASYGYPFWERKPGKYNKLAVTLQGQFYYKALYSPGASKPDAYILIVFGMATTRGADVLTNTGSANELDCSLPDGSGAGMGVLVFPALMTKGDRIRDGVIIALVGGWAAKGLD